MMANVAEVKKAAAGGQLVTVEEYIKKNEHLIVRALNNTISPERFLAVTSIVMQSPALRGCSQSSLVAAVLQTVQVGLTPGAINHVYYVPFNNKNVREVQLIISYKGLVELVNRSKTATVLNAECVFEKDQFQYEQGTSQFLRHVPASGDRGEFIGVYAIAKNMMANEKVFVYLNKEEIAKVRASSKAGASEYSPWVKWFDEMAKKTAVKRLCKLLPLSVEVQQEISADETIKTNIAPKMTDVPDKTDWNTATDAEMVDNPPVKPSEQAPVAPQSTKPPETGKSWQDEADEAASQFGGEIVPSSLATLEVGGELAEFQAVIKSVSVRKNQGKNHDKTVCEYIAKDGQNEVKIAKWGSQKEGSDVGALVTFLVITRKADFRDQKQFQCQDIVVN